jgi:hypothetical protein
MASERDTRFSEKYDLENSHASYPEWFWEQNLRVADLLILVSKGQTGRVAKEIYDRFENTIFVTWRINAIANIIAQVYYTDSNMLNETIEQIKGLDNVEKLEFSEIVKIVGRRSHREIAESISRLE